MIKIITVQTYSIEYEVSEEEFLRFHSMLKNNEDVSEFESDQKFLGENIVYERRN